MIALDFSKTLQGAQGKFTLRIKEEIKKGERVGIFGASGAGKSTILKILAGLLQPDCGEVWVNGELWNSSKVFLPPQKRNIGFVFQDYALFPHLNVTQNIGFGKNVSCSKVMELLEMMELTNIAHHSINQLSGGQAQRVAIARALARDPKILLLDEPFNALDSKIKNKIFDELNALQKALGFVMILVSHQISEIYRLSDRILEINQGNILSRQTPKQTFLKNHLVLEVEVLNLKISSFYAHVEVLLDDEVFAFVCHPAELENIKIGDRIKMMIKSFSPIILK